MKILHVSTARTWRGGEMQLAYLVEELARHGVESRLLCPAESALDRYCRSHDIPTKTWNRRSSIDLAGAQLLSRICREEKIDLVHLHDSHAHTLFCLAGVFFGVRTPGVVSRRVDFPVRGVLSRWKYNYPGVKAILCVSGEIRRVMLPAVSDPARLHVVHSGIDLAKFPLQGSGRLRREFAIPQERSIVANVAAVAPHKDYPTFVRTAARLVAEGIDAVFLIIGGDGGEEKSIREMIEELGLQEHILLTGFRNDIPEILPEIDLLLFTSRTEGLGTTILDAFAAGLPVVATAAGGIPEIVLDKETGLLAPVGDFNGLAERVRHVLADEELRRRLSANAREYVRNFSKEKTAEKTWAIYRDVLGIET